MSLPPRPAAMTPCRITQKRRSVTPTSRTRMTTVTHHGSSPSSDSPTRATPMSALSAIGSAILPKLVTRPRLRGDRAVDVVGERSPPRRRRTPRPATRRRPVRRGAAASRTPAREAAGARSARWAGSTARTRPPGWRSGRRAAASRGATSATRSTPSRRDDHGVDELADRGASGAAQGRGAVDLGALVRPPAPRRGPRRPLRPARARARRSAPRPDRSSAPRRARDRGRRGRDDLARGSLSSNAAASVPSSSE